MATCYSMVWNSEQKKHFPCGKCFNCRKKRIEGWAFRTEKQSEISNSAFFVTLTYADKNLPLSPHLHPTIKKSDVQDYLKRLRKHNEHKAPYCTLKTRKMGFKKYTLGAPIKYYAVGEYGGRFKRPHYHLILFNSHIEAIEQAWSLDGKMLGTIFIGTVELASIQYILKYLCKKTVVTCDPRDDRQREFSLMSKKMGLSYVTPQIIAWHRNDINNRMYVPLFDNGKIPMPRYYKKHFYSEKEREIIAEHLINQQDKKDVEKTIQEIQNEHLILCAKAKSMEYTPMYQQK